MPEVTQRKHHALVRLAHWLMLPLLVGLIMSGLSIYWASPVYPPGFSKSFYDHWSWGGGGRGGAARGGGAGL
jgi:cytochrome b subunit of formate dehydrogenase